MIEALRVIGKINRSRKNYVFTFILLQNGKQLSKVGLPAIVLNILKQTSHP